MNKHNPSTTSNWAVTAACITPKENTISKHRYTVLHLGSALQGERSDLGPKHDLIQIRLSNKILNLSRESSWVVLFSPKPSGLI